MFRRTQDPLRRGYASVTGLLPSVAGLSRPLHLTHPFVTPKECPTTPGSKLPGLGSSRFARRYLGNRIFFLFLRVLRCFSSPGVPRLRYVFTQPYCPITGSGFPHSEISGSQLTYSSPEHIGVRSVLHRLLVPRHPPCALPNFTSKDQRSQRLSAHRGESLKCGHEKT